MALTRERRTALAELMTATVKMNTAKAMLKDPEEPDAAIGQMLQSIADGVERAMAELKS